MPDRLIIIAHVDEQHAFWRAPRVSLPTQLPLRSPSAPHAVSADARSSATLQHLPVATATSLRSASACS